MGRRSVKVHVMVEDSRNRAEILGKFHRSVEQWVCRQNEQPLTRWLARELDSRGSLSRLPISDWHVCLEALREARRSRPGWPAHWDESVARLVIATLRFSRPDGSPAADFNGRRSFAPPETTLRAGLTRVEGTETARHLRDWQASRQRDVNFTPEAPGVGRFAGRAVGLARPGRRQRRLRGDRPPRGQGRRAGSSCSASGRSWLGPSWTIEGAAGRDHARRNPGRGSRFRRAEIAEWSYRVGTARVTQTILLLGGRRLASLSALFEARPARRRNPERPARLAHRRSRPAPLADCRGFRLTGPKRGASAQVLPIGLPSLALRNRARCLSRPGRRAGLSQAPAGRRCWLPLLVSWDSARNRSAHPGES